MAKREWEAADVGFSWKKKNIGRDRKENGVKAD